MGRATPCPGSVSHHSAPFREDRVIFQFRRLESRLRLSFLLIALVPAGFAIGAGIFAYQDVFGRFYGPGFSNSATSAGRLAGDFIERYEQDALAALAALPADLPADLPGVDDQAPLDPADFGVGFIAWETAAGTRIVGGGDSAGEILGLPVRDDWRQVEAGRPPPVQSGRALRFFAPGPASSPGPEGGPARAVGWVLSEETARTLLAVRTDFGRVQKLAVTWETWRLGLLVALPAWLFATAVVAFFLARRTARRVARPVADLAKTADAIAGGDLSQRAVIAGEGEVLDLVLAFNRMGAQLEASREELIRVERVAAWRDVARRIAHEIKNPLTPIRLAIHRLEGRVAADDESSRECLRSMAEEVESLGRIASSFSEFAKMPPAQPAPTDFAAIARSVVDLFREAAPTVETTFEGPDTLPVVADRDQLRRAVTNLVKNAQEAVAGAGGSVRVSLRRAGSSAILEVQDDGPGVPEEIRDSLFRPGVSARPGGSGLGLAMVHRIATDHRGGLQWEQSEPGTKFVLEIPLDPSEPDR